MRLIQSRLAATLCLVLGLVAGGCGSDGGGDDPPSSASGVDRSKYMDELSAGEIEQLGSWSESIIAPGKRTFSDSSTMNARTTSECADSMQAKPRHCLVSLTEDCVVSTKGDPCQMLATAPCIAYINCVSGK